MADLNCVEPCGPNVAEELPSNNAPCVTCAADTPPDPGIQPSEGVADIASALVTENGSIAAGKQAAIFTNIGTTDAMVAGATLGPGQSVSWRAYFDPVTSVYHRLPAIAYEASETATLSITTVE